MIKSAIAIALASVSFAASASFNCVQVQYSQERLQTQFDQLSWVVGNPVPERPGVIVDSFLVEFACAANGPELDYVRARFVGIPMRVNTSGGSSNRTVVWEGDAAIFILENL